VQKIRDKLEEQKVHQDVIAIKTSGYLFSLTFATYQGLSLG
jgi:hypothetical protein